MKKETLDQMIKFRYGKAIEKALEKGREHIRKNFPGTPVTDANVIRFLILRGEEWIDKKGDLPY